jgi:hypothetical protein
LPAIEEPAPPKVRRYKVDDATYEALGEILVDNPNGILSFRDELVSLLKHLDREENVTAKGFYLSAWGGKGDYTFDRIGRGHKRIEGACMSLLGSTQPGKIAEYIRRAVSDGGNDGMIQRFGLLVWPDRVAEWKEIDRSVDAGARETAERTFRRLNEFAGYTDLTGDPFAEAPRLRFDAAAQTRFSVWHAELQKMIRGDLSPCLKEHFSKYAGLVASLALINHMADGGRDAVGEDALTRAISFARYLETHARRAYGAGPQSEIAVAKSLLNRIRKGDLSDGFAARDVYRRQWSNLSDRGRVSAALELLADYDWLAINRRPTGGRVSITFSINPAVRP